MYSVYFYGDQLLYMYFCLLYLFSAKVMVKELCEVKALIVMMTDSQCYQMSYVCKPFTT